MRHLWQPMVLSLQVAFVATAVVALIGVPLAYFMARHRFIGKSIVDALLIVPLVLPPTVVGYLILITLGAHGMVGSLLRRAFDYSILFNWHGAVVASTVVSLPLLYLPARSAFAGIEPEMIDLSRIMGAGSVAIFWHVSLPLARRGIASGLLLAFARALGEFGATVMVMGNLQGRQTLPIAIYDDYISGELGRASPAVIALTVIALLVVLLYNRSLRRGQ
jgi:molybdate transport system permease protein